MEVVGGFSANTNVSGDVDDFVITGPVTSTQINIGGNVDQFSVHDGNLATNLSATSVNAINVSSSPTSSTPLQVQGSYSIDTLGSISVLGGNIDGASVSTSNFNAPVQFVSVRPNMAGVGGSISSTRSFHLAGGINAIESEVLLLNLVAGGPVGTVTVGTPTNAGFFNGTITADQIGTIHVYGEASGAIRTTADATSLSGQHAIGSIQIDGGDWNGGVIETSADTSIGSVTVKSNNNLGGRISAPLRIVSGNAQQIEFEETNQPVTIQSDVGNASLGIVTAQVGIEGMVTNPIIANDQSEFGIVVRGVDQSSGNTDYTNLLGSVYYDINDNGVRDANEPYLNRRRIELVRDDVVLANQISLPLDANSDGIVEPDDEAGHYRFTRVVPGEYLVQTKHLGRIEMRSDPVSINSGIANRLDFPLAKPWTNPNATLDVDANESIVPLDALIVINELNRTGFGEIISFANYESLYYVDTTGDGFLAPLDVLLIINHLNRVGLGSGEDASRIVALSPKSSADEHDLVGVPVMSRANNHDLRDRPDDERSWEAVGSETTFRPLELSSPAKMTTSNWSVWTELESIQESADDSESFDDLVDLLAEDQDLLYKAGT
ncbi:MAG: dockerin type I domain-containing protein [Pirellulaceae bacterium]